MTDREDANRWRMALLIAARYGEVRLRVRIGSTAQVIGGREDQLLAADDTLDHAMDQVQEKPPA